ncbi:TonB-dependent receptor [Pelagerythrobacter sp.]|uniref:TonB-dependent receptor n=1 Tax=Pelagerythrobacter sp. TaxID=2800702 RepID=UPI0035ADAA83
MIDRTGSTFEIRHALLGGISAVALTCALAPAAYAQDSEEPESQDEGSSSEIVVTGVRLNLETAQARKRNADTVVDSITAEDIGSFPDKSVAEALQRVPGVTVVRFAGTDDTSHFSAEPSGVIIRGLNQVRSEFNGRDTFSANSSRGLSWQDVSPELLSGVDTYKNQTADLIEGGIAGTVNLRTRVPFDSDGRLISISIKNTYGDIAKRSTPEISGIISDRWETGIGEFGLLLNGAYSRAITASQGVQYERMGIFQDVFAPGTQYIPSGIFMRDNEYDRKRYGIAGAAQWQSNDGTMQLTAQYLRSQYDNSWREHAIFSSAFSVYGQPSDYVVTDPTLVNPLEGTDPFQFDEDGNFLSGWWSAPRPYVGEGDDNLGLGVNEDGEAFFNRCYAWEGCTNPQRAPQLDTAANALKNKQITQDFGLNFRWDVTDRLRATFDAQYVDASVNNYNASVTARTFANTFVDLTGEYPRLQIEPTEADNINLSSGGVINPNNYHYYAITDHTEDSEGEEVAFRGDLEYDVDSGWLDAIKVGARYADRDQTIRWGAYNWANISNNWTYTQAPYFNIDSPAYAPGTNRPFSFGNDFFAGDQINQYTFPFFNMDLLQNRETLGAALGRPSIGVGEYYPVCSGEGYRAGEIVADEFGCYLPGEIHEVSERTVATYAMARFGGPGLALGDVGVSGNVGVRLVWTRDRTNGSITYPTPFTENQLSCERGTDPTTGLPTATPGCVITADEIAFNTGEFVAGNTSIDHFHALPSFNIKFDLTDKLVSRFAYSRAMSRPDFGLLRNYVVVNRLSPNLNDRSDPNITFDEDGNAVAYDWQYTAQAGNPGLKPITADQFDLTMEYYFAPAGSFTVTGFYKKFHDYIQSGAFTLSTTNNGVTEDVRIIRPVNGDGANIYGAEVAFQTFFDFLPSPFDGFGVQANYTYVHNDGIQSVGLTSQTAGVSAGGGLSLDDSTVQANALEGISKHSYNLVGLYEKGRVSARVAYNWRSEFLVTAIDSVIGFPMWQEDTGYLDASVRLRVSEELEFIVEGTNLLNTDTVLLQQVDGDGTLKPASWFRNDRRFQLGARLTF